MQPFRITEYINVDKKPIDFDFGYNCFWKLRAVELEVRYNIDLNIFAEKFTLAPRSIQMVYYRPNTDVVMVRCYSDQYRVYSPDDCMCGVYRDWESAMDAFNHFAKQPNTRNPDFSVLLPGGCS